MKDAIFALDQSTTHIGHAIFLEGVLDIYGEGIADPPHYDLVRKWVRSHIKILQDDGYNVTCAVETLHLHYYPVKNNKTGRVDRKPQVQVFEKLVRAQSHIWAASRDMGCSVVQVTPYDAMRILTGISDIKTKREDRKTAMVLHASKMLGETVSDHVADAVGIGMAYLSNSNGRVQPPAPTNTPNVKSNA